MINLNRIVDSITQRDTSMSYIFSTSTGKIVLHKFSGIDDSRVGSGMTYLWLFVGEYSVYKPVFNMDNKYIGFHDGSHTRFVHRSTQIDLHESVRMVLHDTS